MGSSCCNIVKGFITTDFCHLTEKPSATFHTSIRRSFNLKCGNGTFVMRYTGINLVVKQPRRFFTNISCLSLVPQKSIGRHVLIFHLTFRGLTGNIHYMNLKKKKEIDRYVISYPAENGSQTHTMHLTREKVP